MKYIYNIVQNVLGRRINFKSRPRTERVYAILTSKVHNFRDNRRVKNTIFPFFFLLRLQQLLLLRSLSPDPERLMAFERLQANFENRR